MIFNSVGSFAVKHDSITSSTKLVQLILNNCNECPGFCTYSRIMDRIIESKSLSFRCKDKLVDLQMVCNFQKLLQAISLCWRKSDKDKAIQAPRYLKSSRTLSPSRDFGGAASLW